MVRGRRRVSCVFGWLNVCAVIADVQLPRSKTGMQDVWEVGNFSDDVRYVSGGLHEARLVPWKGMFWKCFEVSTF